MAVFPIDKNMNADCGTTNNFIKQVACLSSSIPIFTFILVKYKILESKKKFTFKLSKPLAFIECGDIVRT